jgi:hypothetical protein
MDARVTRYVLAGGGLLILAIGIALWHFAPAPVAGQLRAPDLADQTAPGADVSVIPGLTGTDRGFASTSNVPRTAAARPKLEPPVLPPAPTGDYEISVTDPELQAIVEARYGAFLRSLTLTPAATARLRDLLVERQQASIDVANAAMVAGLNSIRDLATIEQAITLAEHDVDVDLAREFGTPVLSALREFESTRAERNTVDDLARALASSAEPLRPVQQQRLVQILRNLPVIGAPADINGVIYGRYDRRAGVSPEAAAAAAAQLSPRQLSALRQLRPTEMADGTSAD